SLIWFTVNIAIKNDISPVASLTLGTSEQLVLRDVAIVVLSPASDAPSYGVNPKTANVTVQGDATSLRNLRKQEVRLLVDLSEPGTILNSRKRIDVSTPAGIAPIRVDPPEVQVLSLPKN